MGASWEAAVKSSKRYLYRAAASRELTRVELDTLVAQSKVCQNSRPIAPLRVSTNQVDVLTLGYFSIGRPLVAAPFDSVPGSSYGQLRWRGTQAALHQIWRVFSNPNDC